MRILLLAEYDEFGGTRTYLKQIIHYYAKRRASVLLISLGPDDDPTMNDYCKSFGVELVKLKKNISRASSRLLWIKNLFSLDPFIENWISLFNPDLIVASVGTPGLFLAHFKRRKGIYINHTIPVFKSKWLKRRIYRFMLNLAINKNSVYIAVSYYQSRAISELWGLKGAHAPKVIHNTAGPLISPISKTSTVFHCLTVGHVVDYKNPFFWVDVAEIVLNEYPNSIFTWIGPGPLIEECRKYVISKKLERSIHFVGPKENPSSLFNQHHLYIQPSRIESLGISVLDAMRNSLPCVVSDSGGLPELVKDKITGFVVNLDDGPHAFAAKICQLADSSELLDRMGKLSADRYQKYFSPTSWENKLDEIHSLN